MKRSKTDTGLAYDQSKALDSANMQANTEINNYEPKRCHNVLSTPWEILP